MHTAPDFPEEDFLTMDEQLTTKRAFELLYRGMLLRPNTSSKELAGFQLALEQAEAWFLSGEVLRAARRMQELETQIFDRP